MHEGYIMIHELRMRAIRSASLVIVGILLALLPVLGFCDSTSGLEPAEKLIENALEAFEKANYPDAIDYLEQALAGSPNNPEIYYYLGYFLHYLCYDSAPLSDYGRDDSDRVIAHLRKALELDPLMGNARYFLGTEYGARAREAMRLGDVENVVAEFREGMFAGGYPDWLVEYGRNILRSCEQNAILIVYGDAETNPIEYLQCVEGYRTDISVIPYALLDEPWFVALLKRGVDSCIASVSISWSNDQILSMHPYKWKSNIVKVPISDNLVRSYDCKSNTLEWLLNPDLVRSDGSGLLSAGRAALVDIIRTNQWARPIHFSLGCPQSLWEGLEPQLQRRGFVQAVLPCSLEEDIDLNATKTLLLDGENFSSVHTLKSTDMPRISYLLQNYRTIFMRVIYSYVQKGDVETARELFAMMKSHLTEAVLPMPENFKNRIEALERMLEDGK